MSSFSACQDISKVLGSVVMGSHSAYRTVLGMVCWCLVYISVLRKATVASRPPSCVSSPPRLLSVAKRATHLSRASYSYSILRSRDTPLATLCVVLRQYLTSGSRPGNEKGHRASRPDEPASLDVHFNAWWSLRSVQIPPHRYEWGMKRLHTTASDAFFVLE